MRLAPLVFLFSVTLFANACSQQSGGELATSATAACPEVQDGLSIVVINAWVNAASATRPTAAVYLTLCNRSAVDDALIGVSFAGAGAAEVHQTSINENGLTSMALVKSLPLPAGKSVALEHGGAHIMLIALTEDLTAGSPQQITLTFENAAAVTIPVDVKETRQHRAH